MQATLVGDTNSRCPSLSGAAAALAGGPNSRPHPDFPYDERLVDLGPQLCYLDEPTSEVTKDICIRWNAPLVYVSSFLNLSR